MSLFMAECELLTKLNSVADNSTVWLIGSLGRVVKNEML